MGKVSIKFAFQIALTTATLLACPHALLAQRGGGRIGGGTAGGTGLSGGNRPTGIDPKDDLRDFHEIMAVQASSEQKLAFAAMVRSTAVAAEQLQALLDQPGKPNNAAEMAQREKNLGDALETSRTLNKKFLEGFSEAQKSGLKEMIKRVNKADLELGQQARALDQASETGAAGTQLMAAAQSLGRAIALFQAEQIDLGEEMSIDSSSMSPESAYNLPAVRTIFNYGSQGVSIDTSGVVSKVRAEGGQNKFAFELTADLTDLQHAFTEILRSQLNKTERCGERIQIETANLTADQPASLVAAQFHYERWTCSTMFGRENINEVVEGSATLEVQLTPAVADDGTLSLSSKISRIDAQGMLGESLRAGALGDSLRDQISNCVLSALLQGADSKAALPASARAGAVLRRARFQDTGAGRLLAQFDGEVRVSNEQFAALATELKRQSTATAPAVQPQLMSR
jgi:hypothetical protein